MLTQIQQGSRDQEYSSLALACHVPGWLASQNVSSALQPLGTACYSGLEIAVHLVPMPFALRYEMHTVKAERNIHIISELGNGHTVSLSVSQSVLYWPMSFWQAGSYSLEVTASLTYARSSFSVVLKMAYRSAA